MKKEIIILSLIFALVVVLNIITQRYTNFVMGEVLDELSSLRNDLKREDQELVKEKIGSVIKKWDENKKKLVIYMEHDEIEKVNMYMLEVNSNSETGEFSQAISSLDSCMFVIEHIKEKYRFSVKNIF